MAKDAFVRYADDKKNRLVHEEKPMWLPTTIGEMRKGDVFVRHGAPCMRMDLGAAEDGTAWIVNLLNGSAWQASMSDQVYPAYEVKLTFATHRRGD